MIFGSVVKEDAEVNDEKVHINYSNRVPFIIVDDEYSKNTAYMLGDSISLISQTLLYICGDKTKKTMVTLRGKKKKANPLQIILIAIAIICVVLGLAVFLFL